MFLTLRKITRAMTDVDFSLQFHYKTILQFVRYLKDKDIRY